MISTTATQNEIINSNSKLASWLFEITQDGITKYWSTKEYIFNNQKYSFKIIPETFKGITLNRSKSELNIQTPNLFSFSIINPLNAFSTASFATSTINLKLVIDDRSNEEIIRQWKFKTVVCESQYQKLKFQCEDFIQQFLEGDYPNTKLIKNIFPSNDPDQGINDNICVAETFGTPYIPLRSILNEGERYYILGSTATFNISKVRSPQKMGDKIEWDSGSYSFNQSTIATNGEVWKVFQPIIADTSGLEIVDSIGLWKEGNKYLDMPTQFSKENTVVNPADVIQYFLENIGISTSDIDTISANAIYNVWGLEFHGAFYHKQTRKKALAQLLSSCHSNLKQTDKIELNILSKESQATLTDSYIIKNSFKTSKIKQKQYDSGYVAFQEANEAQDEFIKILIPTKINTNNISSKILTIPFVQNSEFVQNLGCLHYQRLFNKESNISFSSLSNQLKLEPDDIITINDDKYGGEYKILIDSITINKNLKLDFKCTKFKESFDDWNDLAFSEITIAEDNQSNIWQPVISGPDSTTSTSQIPNLVKGRFRIGQTDNYILFDPSKPYQKFNTEVAGEIIRIGVLDEFLDYGTEGTMGIAIGDALNYLKYDPTYGLRLRGAFSLATGSDVIPLFIDANNLAEICSTLGTVDLGYLDSSIVMASGLITTDYLVSNSITNKVSTYSSISASLGTALNWYSLASINLEVQNGDVQILGKMGYADAGTLATITIRLFRNNNLVIDESKMVSNDTEISLFLSYIDTVSTLGTTNYNMQYSRATNTNIKFAYNNSLSAIEFRR